MFHACSDLSPPHTSARSATITSLPIDALLRSHLVNDGSILVRNAKSSCRPGCVDRGIVRGDGGDPFGGTTALVRRENTGECYPEPSHGSQRSSDGGDGGSFDVCRFRFEFRCDVGSRVEFGYVHVHPSEEDGAASTHDDAFEVILNEQKVALIPGDDGWYGGSYPVTVADAWVVQG